MENDLLRTEQANLCKVSQIRFLEILQEMSHSFFVALKWTEHLMVYTRVEVAHLLRLLFLVFEKLHGCDV